MGVYAVINKENNIIENTVIWDGESLWQPPETHYVINIDNKVVGVNFNYDVKTDSFTPPIDISQKENTSNTSG